MISKSHRELRLPLRIVLVGLLLAILAPVVTTDRQAAADTSTPIMQRNRVTPQQMASWFLANSPGDYAAQTSVQNLTYLFVEEGRAEGVAGDLAFVQSVLETSWFRFPDHGQVRAHYNNYGGIGACDGGTCTVAQFRSPRIGVRAQIQHLRAYADPAVTEDNLAYPLESPRFHLVSPKGRAPTWEEMGDGNWATDPDYSAKILNFYASLLDHAAKNGGTRTSRAFGDVRRAETHAADIGAVSSAGWTNGCRTGRVYCPTHLVTRGQMASFLVRAGKVAPSGSDAFSDVPRSHTHHADINALVVAGITNGCGGGNYCPERPVTRAEVASFLQRTAGLPHKGSARFDDVVYGATHGRAISAIADAGWTNGCGNGNYCPDRPVTRAEMASFLWRAFGT